MSRSRRIFFAVALFVVLAGPAPGAVGGCDEDNLGVDAVEFCTQTKYWGCLRDEAAGRTTAAQKEMCVAGIERLCAGTSWPVECVEPPTQLEFDVCIDALMDVSRLAEPNNNIPECLNLCGH